METVINSSWDEDIYSDLPLANFDAGIQELQENNKNLVDEINNLQEEFAKLTQERDDLQTKCGTLAINISSLLKTAKAEIQRKDKLISELRKKEAEYTASQLVNRKRKNLSSNKETPTKRIRLTPKKNSPKIQSPVSTTTTDFSDNKTKNISSKSETTKLSNAELNTTIVTTKTNLPNIACKTLYSQRMYNKLYGVPNKLSSQETDCVKSHVEESLANGITRKHLNHTETKQELTINVDENLLNTSNKVDIAAPSLTNSTINIQELQISTNSPSQLENETNLKHNKVETKDDQKNDSNKFLRPNSVTVIRKPKKTIISPVLSSWSGLVKTVDVNLRKDENQQENSECNVTVAAKVEVNLKKSDDERSSQVKTDCVNNSDTNDIMDHLFGSPLKWTENSNGSAANIDLTSPTIYEDSCGAHIDNTKFNNQISSTHSSVITTSDKITTENRSSLNKIQQLNVTIINKDSTLESVRAFGEVCSENDRKSLFTTLKNDLCKFSTIDSTTLQFKSKYEDSVLGQFDDTTQFVSALTKVESKISPLNTPVKLVTQSSILPSCPVIDSTQLESKIFTESLSNSVNSGVTKLCSSISKTYNEKPINILYPRKTPRKVTYSKPNEKNSNPKPAASIPDTPTKCNRFAINDAFICQQEEKVLKNTLNNMHDPIAITISAKSKKGKESTVGNSPKGKQSNLSISPKGRQTITNLSPKKKSPNFVSVKGKSPKAKQNSTVSSCNNNEAIPAVDSDEKRTKTESLCENLKPQLNILNSPKKGYNSENNTEYSGLPNSEPSLSKILENSKLHDSKEILNSLTKKIIIPNSPEKRFQNFKCSSHLKKSNKLLKQHEAVRDMAVPLKKIQINKNSIQALKDNQKLKTINESKNIKFETASQNKCYKLQNQKYLDTVQIKKNDKLPIIVRSTEKPKFHSTTVSDDDYSCSSLPRQSLEQIKSLDSKSKEIREWVLTPITFDSDKSHKKSIYSNIVSTVADPREDGHEVRKSSQLETPALHKAQIVIVESKTSPNTIIRGRRPLNFGVSVSLN